MVKRDEIINLDSLVDFSARINESNDEYFILNSTLLSIIGKLKIFRGCVLQPYSKKEYKLVISKGLQKIKNVSYFEIKSFRKLNPEKKKENVLIEAGYHFCQPIMYRQKQLAVLCIGSPALGAEFTIEEKKYLNLICSIAAIALQNTKNIKSLIKAKNSSEKQNQLLKTLFDIGRDFSHLYSRDQILKMLSLHLMGQLMVSRFAVFLPDSSGKFNIIINRFSVNPDERILKILANYETTLRVREIDCCMELEEYLLNVEARVFSPMKTQGKTQGLLLVGKKMNAEAFSEENLQFIEALGNTAILAIENERLFREEIEKKRLESEMNLALEIQQNLLPQSIPEIKGIDLFGISIPSSHVGGDYFDFIKISDTEILIAIADVSGKGMPASLIMANVQASLRILANMNLSLTDLVERINKMIYQNTAADKFVTFFCGIYNSEYSTFKYLNAGHNPPFVIRAKGNVDQLKIGGLILGFIDDGFQYHSAEISLQKQDLIIFYTDGVTEAKSAAGAEYGEDHLIKCIKENKSKPSKVILENLIVDLKEFSDTLNQYDDITAVVLKIL
ncbi:MAG: SpoIIE family protein phosphatase [Candidatus Kapabacteria bacterium]|nr:SpoIIE family protein phosphatase [Candidatus Kapabacteria bacterium]